VIPHPFTRVVFAYGEPILVPREMDEPELEKLRGQVQNALEEATQRAEAALKDESLWKA
jgi:lysophospholipid acyltransferase (LPLAT)-like uncharacterized protein